MEIIENNSSFKNSELIRMARRENNSKRSFLIVNPIQAKHIPANPAETMKLFKELSSELKKHIPKNEKILFIGFAETATAIGTGVASHFENALYMHTTREIVKGAEMVVEFKELHSHAVQQTLQCCNWNEFSEGIDRIVFVEDEISTGTTILNFVNALRENKKVSEKVKFSVCSVINGMTLQRKEELLKEGIEFIYLMKISMENHVDVKYTELPLEKLELKCKNIVYNKYLDDSGVNCRTGINIDKYISKLNDYSNNLIKSLEENNCLNNSDLKIAVIGTEEYMFPAIYTASKLKKKGFDAVTHSTTRSPIEPHNREDYPLKSRETLKSFYDTERITYIYNTYEKYDLVLAVLEKYNPEAEESLISAFPNCKNFFFMTGEI